MLDEAESTMGYMWECPDFFTLNGKRVLMFPHRGCRPKGSATANLFQSGYLIGRVANRAAVLFATAKFREMDHGHGFYAPQASPPPMAGGS